jgi:EmrB/QacA subfamily drug resistance transporter
VSEHRDDTDIDYLKTRHLVFRPSVSPAGEKRIVAINVPVRNRLQESKIRVTGCSVMNEHGRTKTSKTSVLMVAALTTFMGPFMLSSVNVALPAIQAEFSLDAVLLSWIANAYLLASGVALVPVGKVGDIYGRKKVFAAGIFVFTLFTVATALCPSLFWILVCRMLQGFGAAMTMATSFAIISSVFPKEERGRAIGITVSSVYLGLSVGPSAGGLLISSFGWRSIFLVNAPLGVLSFVLCLLHMRDEWADAKGQTLDVVGSLLYGVSVVGLIYGLSLLPAPMGVGLLGFGIIAFSGFVWYENRTRFPVFEVRLFRDNRTFAFSGLAALINYSATFAVAFLLSLYLQYIKGMSPKGAGLVLIWQPLVMALFSPLAGRLSDRVEPSVIASLGMMLTAVGLFLLTFLSGQSATAYVIACLVVLGFGFALFSSPNMNAIMSSVEKKFYGVASGTVATMRLIGQMLSMATATLVFSIFIGKVPITPSNYGAFLHSMIWVFWIFSALCVTGIFFSWSRGALRQKTNR